MSGRAGDSGRATPGVLILAGSSDHADHATALCELAGHAPFIATDRQDVRSKHAMQIHLLDPPNRTPARRTAERINAIAALRGVTVLLPADTAFTLWVLQHREKLETECFPLPELDAFRTLRNKASFARLMGEIGAAHPRTVVIRRKADLASLDFPAPAMVKPTMREGGRLVTRVENARDLPEVARSVMADNKGPIIVQEFIEGTDIDLSLLASRGEILAHTIQTRRDDAIEFLDHDEVLAIGRRICQCTRFTGLAHLDMRQEAASGRIVTIEANPRIWASIGESLRVGVNFIGEGLKLVTRDENQPRRALPRNSSRPKPA